MTIVNAVLGANPLKMRPIPGSPTFQFDFVPLLRLEFRGEAFCRAYAILIRSNTAL
jgi:hypothetical protein